MKMKWYGFYVSCLLLFVAGCGVDGAAVATVPQVATLAPTAVSTLVPPTKTEAPPTATAAPTLAATPSPLPTATFLPTETAVPTQIPVDRTCPADSPEKPEYRHDFLAPEPWPTPDAVGGEAHFWLTKPLPPEQPLDLNLSYPYGSDGNGRYLLHNGLDSLAPKGIAVLAAGAGTVVYAGPDAELLYGWGCDWYGNLVVIEHDELWRGQPVYSLYGHVLEVAVETGQRVEPGERLAAVGLGGVATHPHLHFEVRVGRNEFGATRNPLLWLEPGADRGVIVGRLVDGAKRPWQGARVTLIDGSGAEVVYTHTSTYLDDPEHLIKPDEGYAENFVFGDVAPGNYELFTQIEDVAYRQAVVVVGGEVSVVEMIVELKTQ